VLPLLDAALRGALLALLLLLAANLARLRARVALERVGLALTLGLCVQLVAHAPAVESRALDWWMAPLVGVAMGNAVLFWLFARTLCDDDFAPAPRHWAAWVAMCAVGALNLALLVPWCVAGAPGWAQLVSQVVFSLPLVFGLLAIRAAAAHWRDDLVETRRWLRLGIVLGGSVYTVVMVLARRTTSDGRLTAPMAAADTAALLLIVAAAAWLLLRPTRGELLAVPAAAEAPAGADAVDAVTGAEPIAQQVPHDDSAAAAADGAFDARLADALQRCIGAERAYKDPTLSVAGLAARLSVPEYRLRHHINKRLGHRNFNAFLNHYRLAEARTALADPAQRRLPVLTIALEAGFGSIGPFNRAFKAVTGMTPTDFRQQSIADS